MTTNTVDKTQVGWILAARLATRLEARSRPTTKDSRRCSNQLL